MKKSPSLRAALVFRMMGLMRERFATMSVEQARAMTVRSGFPLPKGVSITPADGLDAQWIRAGEGASAKVLMYLHGGGYVQKSPGAHYPLVARLVMNEGFRAGLYVDYRLAPEHPYPAGLEDVLAAYRWLLGQGIAAHNLVLAGDSAGGGLALATMVCLREEKTPLPAAAVMMSPWCDLTLNGRSAVEDRDPTFTRGTFLHYAHLYAGDMPLDHPMVSPLNADLSGLPPMLIQAGERELLRDDAVRLAERVRAAGGRAQLSIYPGMGHVWQVYPPFMMPESRDAVGEIGAFLRGLG